MCNRQKSERIKLYRIDKSIEHLRAKYAFRTKHFLISLSKHFPRTKKNDGKIEVYVNNGNVHAGQKMVVRQPFFECSFIFFGASWDSIYKAIGGKKLKAADVHCGFSSRSVCDRLCEPQVCRLWFHFCGCLSLTLLVFQQEKVLPFSFFHYFFLFSCGLFC